MARYWANVYDSTGALVGDGPLGTIIDYVSRVRMDRAGTWQASLPAAEAKIANVTSKCTVAVYGLVDGAVAQVGKTGIVEDIGRRFDARGAPLVTLSGPDLLAELAYRTVGDLEIYEVASTLSTPDKAFYLNLRNVPPTNSAMNNALDGNPGTSSSARLYQHEEFIYIGHTTRFSEFRLTLASGQTETDGDVLRVQYFSRDDGWKDVSSLSDGTDDGSNTLRQTGNVSYDRPDDWVTTRHGDYERYWIRLDCNTITDTVQIAEIQIYAEQPSTTPVADVMAYAPSGWTQDGEAGTGVMVTFSGQTVLEALTRIADITGEHFRLGDGREVEWLSSQRASGVRAVTGGDPVSLENSPTICQISTLSQTLDSNETITRIYPYGGGTGDERVTLASATETPPAGYTLNKPDNYLEYDAGSPRVDAIVTWGDIGKGDDENATDASVSNTLYHQAYNYLRQRVSGQTTYDLAVVGLGAQVDPGDTLHVVAHAWMDGYHAINIDDDLTVLETRTIIEREAAGLSHEFSLSSTDMWPDSDGGMTTEMLQRIARLEKGAGLTLGQAAASASGVAPGTLAHNSQNAITGTYHTHAIDASSDPGEAIALLKTNADGELTLEWLYVTWDLQVAQGDVDILDGALYVDGDLYVNTGPIRLNGGYIGADTDDYSWTWLRGTGGSDTEEVWDFGVSAPWADTLDGHGGYFTFRGRTVYAGSSGAFPALARWHWWAADVTQETYKGAAGIALLKGTGGNGDGSEEMVLSLVAGGDHTLKLQDNAGATKICVLDSDDSEVASIDSDGLLSALGMVSGGHLLPAASEAYDLGSPSRLWRSGYLSELRALLFAEETIQLVGGWLIVPKDAGTFEADVADTDLTIDFGKAMTPGHWVLVRSYDASTGMPAAEYLTVGSLVSGTTYNVTRNVDGSGANDWAAGTPFLVLGEEGDGRIELNAYDTPRIQILQQGAAYNLADEVVRIGDLDGAFGITEERYGFGVGDYAAANYLRYDPVAGFLLSAGGGEIAVDENGITVGYDAVGAMRFQADSGGTEHDVIYHDAGADALHLESATQYWEIMEYQGAKLAADGGFFKFQERENTQLQVNGGFETAGSGTTFDGWSESGTDGSVSDETSSVHGGSHAAKITAGASTDMRIAQTIAAPFNLEGYTVVLSFWTRGDGLYAPGRYRVWGNGYDGWIVPTTSTQVTGKAFTHVTTQFTCPTGTTSIILTFLCPNVSGRYAIYDDVTVALYWEGARVGFGSADDNFAVFTGQDSGYGPALRLQLDDTPDDYGRSMDMQFVGHFISDANADPPVTFDRATPQVTYVSVDVPPSTTCLFLQGVKYLGVALYVFNLTDGKAQGHVFTEIGWQGYDYVSVYSTNDPTKAGDTTGECYVRLYENDVSNRYTGDAILRNGNASKTMRFVGWVTYMTA
jgi:hypothetical protein